MAAILCSSIASLCQGVGKCLSYPCRLCGFACDGCCKTLGHVLASPFSPYLITTLALNSPPLAWGIRAMMASNGGLERCNGDLWLWVDAILCLGHMLAAFYIVYRIQKDEEQRIEEDTESGAATPATKASTTSKANYQSMHDDSRNKMSPIMSMLSSMMAPPQKTGASSSSSSNQNEDPALRGAFLGNVRENGSAYSWQRLKQVLCYDMVVAIYIVGAIFWLIWQSMGVQQALNSGGENGELCESIHRWISLSIMCGFIYSMLVFIAFSCSFLCIRH
ncbi:hypothetical protein ACA910_008324 [Epithemia clementina (nom. ined.)]